MPKWLGGSALNPPSFATPDQWEEQWWRVVRWYQRCQGIKGRSITNDLNQGDFDFVHSFFLNCFQLKDWIRVSHPELTKKLDDLFAGHFELGACRDLANGYKHKSLCRPTHDAGFNLYMEYDHFMAAADASQSPVQYCLAFADGTDIRKFELFEFIDRCLGIWEAFVLTKFGSEFGVESGLTKRRGTTRRNSRRRGKEK
jgi:hypothetical protein